MIEKTKKLLEQLINGLKGNWDVSGMEINEPDNDDSSVLVRLTDSEGDSFEIMVEPI